MFISCWPCVGQFHRDSHIPTLKFLLVIFIFVLYLVLGASIFSAIEGPSNDSASTNLTKLKQLLYQQNSKCMSEDDLEEFIKVIVDATNQGISPMKNASNELNWSFGQSFLFSTTLITTIGYGNVTPLSQLGKIFTMLYAIVGIPLTMVLITASLDRILVPAMWLLGFLNSKLGHLYQPTKIRVVHLTLISIVIAIFCFVAPTIIFTYLEPTWTYLDSFYYCFISLSTIGLGDYTPSSMESEIFSILYKVGISVYLVVGLTGLMLIFAIFYEIPQLNLGQLFNQSNKYSQPQSESEKSRLASNKTPCYSGPSGLYMPQRDDEVRRSIVRIRPHGEDSPSPDEAPSTGFP
ncbi:KCNK1 family protein [Megaselia abdita]